MIHNSSCIWSGLSCVFRGLRCSFIAGTVGVHAKNPVDNKQYGSITLFRTRYDMIIIWDKRYNANPPVDNNTAGSHYSSYHEKYNTAVSLWWEVQPFTCTSSSIIIYCEFMEYSRKGGGGSVEQQTRRIVEFVTYRNGACCLHRCMRRSQCTMSSITSQHLTIQQRRGGSILNLDPTAAADFYLRCVPYIPVL